MKCNLILFVLLKFLISVFNQLLPLNAKINNSKLRHGEDEIRNILKDDYPIFVRELGERIHDLKFREAIRSLAHLKKLNFSKLSVPVRNLTPTQNEIDLTNSLRFLLISAETVRIILGCIPEQPIKIANKPIVTSSFGDYIIDGHHRWSQVYVGNRKCVIETIDLNDIDDPIQALKITQLGIAGSKDKYDKT